MKLHELISRVRDAAHAKKAVAGPYEIAVIVGETLSAVDLHVAADGEIYSPAPPPSLVIPNVPAMNAARYGGRKRRR